MEISYILAKLGLGDHFDYLHAGLNYSNAAVPMVPAPVPPTVKKENNPPEAEKEAEKAERVILGVQHRGKVTTKEATKMLRKEWPRNVVKEVEVKRRREVGVTVH